MPTHANILVVDDTPANLRLLVRLLKNQGYTVLPAPSGKHALEVARSQAIDVVLLDIMMPEMDGYEVCRRLKAQEATRDIPILFLSALNDPFDKVKAFDVGGVDYITKPFQAEEVLARVETHLSLRRMHQRVQDYNTQLREHQEQLRQEIAERKRTGDALREANATKDTFFSIIAHDLRSPFTALLGHTELALSSFETLRAEEVKNHITQIKTSAEAVYALLGNLLAWVRVQRGMIDYQPIDFPLHQLIEEVFQFLASSAEHKQIVLDAHIPATIMVHADRNMLNTVIRNLVSNALKFIYPGGSITISARQRGTTVAIAVSDTGTGIPEAMLPNVFRVDIKTTSIGTDGEQGTGLGLPLCKDLIEKNGGRIRVKSTPGQGATFELTLPCSPDSCHTPRMSSEQILVTEGTSPLPAGVPSSSARTHAVQEPSKPRHTPHAPVMTGETLQAALARLPKTLQAELRHAAEMLDLETITHIVERIRPHDELLAETLATFVRRYQFYIIQEALEGIA